VEGGITVHTHLRMDGSWRIRPARDRIGGSHRIRLVLANDTWQAVGYQLGIVEVLPTAQEASVVGHLGPDLLGPDWDEAEAARRLRAVPARAIGEALLDQRNLAGIGNLYKAEVLFLRGVDPWRPAGEVTGLDALVSTAQQLMDANKERFSQVTTGVRRPDQQTWVYGRAGRPCRRCGTLIRAAEQGGDTTEADHLLVPALPVLTGDRSRAGGWRPSRVWPPATPGGVPHASRAPGPRVTRPWCGTGSRPPRPRSRRRRRRPRTPPTG
jgi:endonuclease-8